MEFTYEPTLSENASFDVWEAKNFFNEESKINQLTRPRQVAKDLPIFKSNFNSDLEYVEFLKLKELQNENIRIKQYSN